MQVLWVQFLLGKVDKDTPAPVLLLHGVFNRLNLDANEPTRDQKWHDVLWLAHNLADFSSNLFSLQSEFLLSADHFLLRNSPQFLELLKFVRKLSFDFRQDSLVLKLVETLHDDVFGQDVFNPHHVEEHVVTQVEGRVKGIGLAF